MIWGLDRYHELFVGRWRNMLELGLVLFATKYLMKQNFY
jgi:hypothetical protein